MNKIHYIVTMAVLLVSTALFTSFVFVPTINPFQVVNVEVSPILEPDTDEIPVEKLPTLDELWNMEKDQTKIMSSSILNREVPSKWIEKKIFFKYTYIGEYNEDTQKVLDELLLSEYKWQKQLDNDGNIIMGGIILSKDGTYQLHTHNTFTKGEKFFLLGDLLDRYNSNGNLVGTQIKYGPVILEAVWAKDTRISQDSTVPYADLIISTCLEIKGDRRLISGWNIVRE